MLSVRRERAPRVPRDGQPSADRLLALHQRESTHAFWNYRRGGNHANAITDRCQCGDGMRSGAFHKNTRSNVSDVAGGVEPTARSETTLEQKHWLISQFRDLKRAAARKSVLGRQHRQVMDGVKQSVAEAGVGYQK